MWDGKQDIKVTNKENTTLKIYEMIIKRELYTEVKFG
jgi:hypothetical protein